MKLSILQALWNSIIKIIVINYTFCHFYVVCFVTFLIMRHFFEKDELFSIFFINAFYHQQKRYFFTSDEIFWLWLLNSEELVKKVDFDFKFGKWNELNVRKRPATELSFLISPFFYFLVYKRRKKNCIFPWVT